MTVLMTWLTPAAGPAHDELTATIDRLAAELDAPRFQPHVTVLVTPCTGQASHSPSARGRRGFTLGLATGEKRSLCAAEIG